MIYQPDRALKLLRLGSGQFNARFREGQEEAIQHVVEGIGRLLVVQKTGWARALSISLRLSCSAKRGADNE